MGLINTLISTLFGGKNIVKQTADMLRPNAEKQLARGHAYTTAALAQFSSKFGGQGWFNRFVDGLNRMPRPAFALGSIALFASAMFDPQWFVERMQGLALAPEQLWWLLGVFVSCYFGARKLYKIRSGGIAKEAARILHTLLLWPSRSSGCVGRPRRWWRRMIRPRRDQQSVNSPLIRRLQIGAPLLGTPKTLWENGRNAVSGASGHSVVPVSHSRPFSIAPQ